MILVLFLTSIVAFTIVHFAPGDPLFMYTTPGLAQVELTPEQEYELRESLGLNGTILEQYGSWLKNTLRGNWGKSINNFQPVLDQIMERVPATIGLMGGSLIFAVIVAIPLGLIAGYYNNRWPDRIISFFTYVGISIPQFWFGIVMVIIFSLNLKLLPSSGMRTLGVDSTWDLIKHSILPVIVLAFGNIAVFVRYVRSNTISQLEEDYVVTAVSKGIPKKRILVGHVLKNCLLPIITVVGMNFSSLVAGSVVIESVFGWPGLGTLTMTAVNNRDYPMIMGTVILSSVILQVGNLTADLLYSVVDPRISLGGE